MHKDTHNKQKECIKQQAIRKKYTRYDEKNEIRRKSKKYLGQFLTGKTAIITLEGGMGLRS